MVNDRTTLVFQACSSNPMSHLVSLVLEHCPQITAEAVQPLLAQENELEYLALNHCQEIYRRDYEQMLKYVKKHKYLVQIYWH